MTSSRPRHAPPTDPIRPFPRGARTPERRPAVLAVDDDPTARCFVEQMLAPGGIDVHLAADAEEFRRKRSAVAADLYIVDVELPGACGFALGAELGGAGGPPIVYLSVHAALETRLRAFELGAVEYLVKPVPPREFALRIGNIMESLGRRPRPPLDRRRRFGGLALDPAARSLVAATGGRLALTAAEFELLALLTREPGRTRSRDEVAAALGASSAAHHNARIVDGVVWRLRRKLGDDVGAPRFIATIPSQGYRFIMPVEAD